jgi:hypothetical protein
MDAHTYKRLLFGGAAIAGAAAVATIWPVGAVAAVAAGVAGGVGGNFLHQCSDDLAAALAKSPAYATDYLHNQDLRRLVGETVAARLKVLADDDTLPEQTRRRLPVLAIKAEEGWLTLADHELLQGLNEVVVTGLFAMSAASFAKATALDASTWASFLTYLESKVADESTFETLRRTYTQDMKALRSKPLDSAAYSTLGEILQRTIPHDLSIAAKQAFAQNKPAYAALQLRLMRDLMTDVRDVLATVSRMADRVDQLFVGQTEILKSLMVIADAVKGKAPAVSTAVPAANAHDIRDILDEIEASHREISTALARIEEHTALLPGMKLIQEKHGDDLAVIRMTTDRYLPPPPPPSKSNFVDANILPNTLFEGRGAQLSRLATHFASPVNDAGKSLSRGHIVIVGEGGMGKSQLAQRYAEVSADAWKGVWWIDASPIFHDASLRKLIAFLKLPVSDMASTADRRNAIRNYLYGLGRHLIILDSFEAPDTASPNYTLLKELDPGHPACLLITTRDGNLPDHFGPHIDLPVLDEDAAIALLCRDTPRLQPNGGAVHDAALRNDLRAVCVHLGFHALAVDLAGAHLKDDKGLSPAALLNDLKDSDAATLALFDKGRLKGKAHRYAASVGQTLSLHLPQFADAASRAVLSYVANHAPDSIDPAEIAATTGLSVPIVRECLVRLAGASIVKYTEGGEHGIAKIHVLMQLVLRVVLFGPGDGGSGGGDVRSPSPLPMYLDRMRETFADVAKHELYPRRTRLLPHAESLLAHTDGGRGGPEIAKAAASLRAEIAWHRLVVGDLAGAEKDIARSITWGESQNPRDERSLTIWYASRAIIRQDRGDLAGAEADIAMSITWAESQTPPDERGFAIRYATRASIRQDRGDLAGAEADIAKSITWGESQNPRDERNLAILYASRARIRQDRGDLAGAEADIAMSITWGESQNPPDERALAIRYATRASIRQDRGDLEGAEDDIAKSITWGESQNPRDERNLAIRYTSRARIRHYRGDLAGAEADIAKSIAWAESQTPRDERGLAIHYASRARIRQSRGDLEGAEDDIAKSITWGESQNPRDERGLAILYASRARIRQDRGDLAGAEDDIAQSITWGESRNPRDERSLAILYASRASIRQQHGDLAGAEKDINWTINWEESQTQPNPQGLAFSYGTKSIILAKAGKFPQARAAIDESVRLHTAVFGADHEWTKRCVRRQQAIHAGKDPG